ncbi:MAG: flagellar hook capping FlgD N-terminal domain-containing protein [Hyphomonadaceae bacterium]
MNTPISFVPQSTSTNSSGQAVVSQGTLADNFDTFLSILTAQIQNQDPLEPLDSTQFTEQLVQFSGVEQQIRANQQLEDLLTATRSNAGATMSGYLGQEAEIGSSGAAFSGDPIKWRYTLGASSDTTTIKILDQDGKTVYEATGETDAGFHDFVWDGTKTNGEQADPGAYYMQVTATTSDDEVVGSYVSLIARITGVDLTYGDPALTTDAGIFAYSDVLRLTDAN